GEVGQLGLQRLVVGGRAGDQARPPGAGAPAAGRLDRPLHDLGVGAQAEVVVGGQIDHYVVGGTRPQGTVEVAGPAVLGGGVEPVQCGGGGDRAAPTCPPAGAAAQVRAIPSA